TATAAQTEQARADLEAELARINALADERSQSIAALTQARDALVGERDDLQSRLDASIATAAQTEQARVDLEAELARINALADERSQSIAALTQTRDTLVGERDDLQSRLTSTEETLSGERQGAMAAAASAAAAALLASQQHSDELGEVQSRLDGMTATAAQTEQARADLEAELARISALADERSQSIAALTQARDALVGERDDLQSRLSSTEETLSGERQGAMAAAASAAAAALLASQRHSDELGEVQSRLDGMTATAAQTEQARAELEAELARISALADERAQSIQVQEREREALAGERDDLLSRLAVSAETAAQAEQARAELEAELARIGALAHERSRSIEALTQSHDALVGERDELQGRIEALVLRLGDEAESGQRALAQALGEQRQAHEQAWAGIEAQLAEREQQLAELGTALDACRAAREQALAGPVPAAEAVSPVAQIAPEALERLVLAAGAGRAPARVDLGSGGAVDDLKIIDGIGPVNEAWLHAQGVWHFWQIASWGPEELAWVAHRLPNFGSRVYRENWVAQAVRLMKAPSA
ncbi:hypothetical protein, partial [Sphaerotilus uruguayifluvii]